MTFCKVNVCVLFLTRLQQLEKEYLCVPLLRAKLGLAVVAGLMKYKLLSCMLMEVVTLP